MNFIIIINFTSIDPDSEVCVADVLSFFTGAEKIPPIGLPSKPELNFCPSGDYPTASTCALHLCLPTTHWNDYTTFEKNMITGFKHHGGFGLL